MGYSFFRVGSKLDIRQIKKISSFSVWYLKWYIHKLISML